MRSALGPARRVGTREQCKRYKDITIYLYIKTMSKRMSKQAVASYLASWPKSQQQKNTKAIKKLKSMSHQEINVHDLEQASTAITDAGTLFPLCLIVQGLDLDDRTGSQIRIKSIDIRGRCVGNLSATVHNMRVILLRSNNGLTTVPAVQDVLQSADVFSHYEAVTQ